MGIDGKTPEQIDRAAWALRTVRDNSVRQLFDTEVAIAEMAADTAMRVTREDFYRGVDMLESGRAEYVPSTTLLHEVLETLGFVIERAE